MSDNRNKRPRANLSSLLGWVIFVLVIAGGPIFRMISQAFSGSVNLPANLPALVIGGLVALSVIVSLVRSVGGRVQRSGDQRLPTSVSTPARPMSAPMPPFGGSAAGRTPGASMSPQVRAQPQRTPGTPQFDPLFNPRIVVVAVAGLLVLGGLVFVLLLGNLP